MSGSVRIAPFLNCLIYEKLCLWQITTFFSPVVLLFFFTSNSTKNLFAADNQIVSL